MSMSPDSYEKLRLSLQGMTTEEIKEEYAANDCPFDVIDATIRSFCLDELNARKEGKQTKSFLI